MIRYVVDQGAPKPLDDDPCRQLNALGLRRAGAYRAGTRAGEVWIDADGSTMVAVEPLGFGMTVSAQTVLEDGMHVTTEQRPPLLMWLVLGPGVTLPAERTSLRFPKVRDVKALLDRHREHVAEIVKARRSPARLDGDTARYVATRNDAQLRSGGSGRLQLALGGVFFVLGAVAAFGVSRWRHIDIGGGVPFVIAFGTFIAGFLFLGPALIHTGLFGKRAARVPVSAVEKDEERAVRAISSRVPYIIAFYLSLFGLAVGAMAATGMATSSSAIAGLSLALGLEQMLSVARNRHGRRSRPVTYEIANGELRVEGHRPIPLGEISAVLRSEIDKPSLAIVNRRGRVVLRLIGPTEMLDELRDALALERVTLPVTRDPRYLLGLAVPFVASLLGAWAVPDKASGIYSIGAFLMMLMPLIDVRRRPGVEVGIDGLLLQNRFVAFADIASLSTTAESLAVKEKSGKSTTVSLALVGSAAEIARRWNAHSERAETRDADVAARRRVAVAEGEDVPYRVRVATAEELGDVLLDSSEDKSVRVRAARRLAQSHDEEAARVREDVDERVVDPDVRQELRRSHD